MEQNTATTEPVSARSVGLKYGLILGVVSIIFFLVLALASVNPFDNIWNWVGLLFTIAAVVLAHKSFKESNDGFMTYGQGVGISFWIALISTLLGGIFTYLYITMVDGAILDAVFDKQREQMEAQGMPDDQIDMGIGIARSIFWVMYCFMGIFFGTLVGVVVSIFTQKKAPEQVY